VADGSKRDAKPIILTLTEQNYAASESHENARKLATECGDGSWYNPYMLTAPSHDWSYFESRTRVADAVWLRGLTPHERFEIYASLFNAVWNARQNLTGDWDRVEARRWQEKLELRNRAVDAFQKLDRLQLERSTANNAG
jgi:hypothetical protein